MKVEKVNIEQKLSLFNDHWNPRIVGKLNGQLVKLVKFKGEFLWHKHDHEDEMFYALDGEFKIEFRDKTIEISKDEFIYYSPWSRTQACSRQGGFSYVIRARYYSKYW